MLTQWAKTSPFRDESGGLSFMTEAEITPGVRSPQQPDDYSCGVYMLMAIWGLMASVDLHSVLQDGAASTNGQSVQLWRDRLALCLFTNQLGAVG